MQTRASRAIIRQLESKSGFDPDKMLKSIYDLSLQNRDYLLSDTERKIFQQSAVSYFNEHNKSDHKIEAAKLSKWRGFVDVYILDEVFATIEGIHFPINWVTDAKDVQIPFGTGNLVVSSDGNLKVNLPAQLQFATKPWCCPFEFVPDTPNARLCGHTDAEHRAIFSNPRPREQ